MQIANRAGFTAGAKPYGAEVEYVRTDGNQYVLTGVVPASTIRIEGKFRWNTIVAQARLFGSLSGTNTEYSLYRGGSYVSARGGSSSTTAQFNFAGSAGTVYSFDYTAQSCTINNISRDIGGSHPAGTVQLALFGRNNYNVVYYNDYKMFCDLYWMKIWLNGALVRDYTPVRKRASGYLYDAVSGSLFGSETSTPLIAGPDLTA